MPDAAPHPEPAATILLLRDAADGLEVLMVERHHQIDFVAGAMVFPGGRVDPADADPDLAGRCEGAEGLSPEARAFRVAAIRETFEEAGVLMARPRGSDQLVDAAQLATLSGLHREAVHAGELSIGALAAREDLVLACDALVPFAHWITPTLMPKRFDTHFFVVAAPSDHVAAHDGIESVDSVWIRPEDVVADAEARRRQVIFPTLMNVKKLGRSPTVADALAAARRDPIVTVLPVIEDRDGEPTLVLPREAGYEIHEAPVSVLR